MIRLVQTASATSLFRALGNALCLCAMQKLNQDLELRMRIDNRE